MNYNFKDTTPHQNEPMADDNYYTDFTELDKSIEYSLTELSELIKTKGNGKAVRDIFSLAFKLIEQIDGIEDYHNEKYDEYYRQFNDVITELSEEKDYHSLPEIAGARGGFDTLGERLDDTTTQLAQKATKGEVNINHFDEPTRQTFLEAQGIDVNYVLGKENVTPENTTFLRQVYGKNLFNQEDVVLNAMYHNGNIINVDESYNYGAGKVIGLEGVESVTISLSNTSSPYIKVQNVFFFDRDDVVIGNVTEPQDLLKEQPIVINIPEGTHYAGISINGFTLYTASGAHYMVEVGITASEYEEFEKPYYVADGITIPKVETLSAEIDALKNTSLTENKVALSLPRKYELVVGDTFELFYKGIVLANDPYNYNIKVECDVGSAYERKFVFNPNVTGTHPLKISIYDNNEILLDSKSVNLNVKNKASSPSSLKNVLCVGDSLTAYGEWAREFNRRLVATDGIPVGDGLSNIGFIGTKSSRGTRYEGYSGWNFTNFNTNSGTTNNIVWIAVSSHDKTEADQHSVYEDSNGVQWKLESIETEQLKLIRESPSGTLPISGSLTWVSGGENTNTITYTSTTPESNNPFWNVNENKVDFAGYANELGINSIDHCYVLLGWNTSRSSEQGIKIMVKNFINNLLSDFPSCKINLMGIQVPSIDGLGHNYTPTNWNYYEKLKYVFNLNKWYQDVANEYPNVDFINIAGQFDSEYNMPTDTRPVNVRSEQQEVYGTNGVHPMIDGYNQIADAAYRHLSHYLK